MHRELRESIESGSYLIDPALVAEAMIGRLRRDDGSAVFVAPKTADGGAVATEQRQTGALGDHT